MEQRNRKAEQTALSFHAASLRVDSPLFYPPVIWRLVVFGGASPAIFTGRYRPVKIARCTSLSYAWAVGFLQAPPTRKPRKSAIYGAARVT